jgi:prephenate dehydrogenase
MFNNIAIIGAGLMGVSLYKALAIKKTIKNLILLAKNQEQVKSLAKLDIIASSDYLQLKNIEFIIIATPLKSYQDIINKLKLVVNKDVIISDIGSVKVPIIKLFKQQAPLLSFVPAHPIAGSQKSGVGSLVKNLYQDKKLIICHDKNSKASIATKGFWQEVGMKPQFLAAQEHDEIYAYMSHIIQKTAFNVAELLNIAQIKISSRNDDLQILFNKFTRLADSNRILWQDIFDHNQQYIIKAQQGFLNKILTYHKLLKNANFTKLINEIKLASTKKPQLIMTDQKIITDNLTYYIFAIIISAAVINNIEDQEYLAYAGSGFNDMVAIIDAIKLIEVSDLAKSQEKLLLLLEDFHSKFK